MRICWGSNKINADWESLFQSYRRFVQPSHVVLEIGASVVERTREISRHCARVIGVELMPERKPADHGNIHYVLGNWEELTAVLEPESVDVAISSHVIEHVPDDLKALNELHRVLKPGGVAIINTPNRRRLTRRIVELFTGERKFPYWEHQREYIEADLQRLLESTAFKRYEIHPLVFGLHGGPVFCYMKTAPHCLRGMANYWEILLFKDPVAARPPGP
ncbi:MAG: methyltransferase domain-containing protein [Verrucomicrobia bacterium]|nr:methyltransferase domain-containing protein [Verrucomicrobiota bacterium]